MIKLYADLCEAGLRTVKDEKDIMSVPLKWKSAVIQELINRGREDLI